MKFTTILLLCLLASCYSHSQKTTTTEATVTGISPQTSGFLSSKSAKTYLIDEHGHTGMIYGLYGQPGDTLKIQCTIHKHNDNIASVRFKIIAKQK